MTTWRPVEPTWAAPPEREIADLHWLAARLRTDRASRWAGGVVTALSWVRGGTAGPVTERDEVPVTWALARAETWAAMIASDPPGSARPPVQSICADLGVTWREPRPDVHPEWADGTYRALRWLLGLPGLNGHEAPLTLPVRHPDGTVPTEEELYNQAVAAAPWRYRLPEEQIELRHRVCAEARRNRARVALIEDTKRRLTVV